MNLVVLGLFAKHVRIGGAELSLVECLAEFLAAFLHLLVHLVLDFGEIVLDEYIGAVPLLGVLVVDKRIIEGTHMSGRFPNLRVHEDAGIDSHYILVEADHRVPPVLFDIVL